MKKIDLESSVKAGMIYAALKALLQSVGLANNNVLGVLIQYGSLTYAVFDLMEEELQSLSLYIEPFQKAFNDFYNKKDTSLIHHKIDLICKKDTATITIERQKNLFNKICTDFKEQAKEQLFTTAQDSFNALCIILGDVDTCNEYNN